MLSLLLKGIQGSGEGASSSSPSSLLGKLRAPIYSITTLLLLSIHGHNSREIYKLKVMRIEEWNNHQILEHNPLRPRHKRARLWDAVFMIRCLTNSRVNCPLGFYHTRNSTSTGSSSDYD